MSVPPKPPPKTIPGRAILKKSKTLQLDLEIMSEIVRDGVDATIKGGETKFDPIGAIPDGKGGKSFYAAPGYAWKIKDGLKVVTKLSGPVVIKGTIKVQTSYSPKAKDTDTSAYGRGTTVEDEKSGNTTLGFHESCHREDYLTFVKTEPLPTFRGSVGMTEQEYILAGRKFAQAFDKFFKDMESDSEARTDEVGYKKSTFKAKGPRP